MVWGPPVAGGFVNTIPCPEKDAVGTSSRIHEAESTAVSCLHHVVTRKFLQEQHPDEVRAGLLRETQIIRTIPEKKMRVIRFW